MPVNRKGSALCVFVMALVSVSVRWWGLRRLKPLLGVTTRAESTKQPPAVIEEEPHEIARGNDELRIKHDGRYSRRVGDSNRCSDLDMRLFDRGRACGPPMSSPCVDLSRCHGGDTAALPAVRGGHDSGMGGVKIYVFDSGCSLSDSGDLLFDGAEQDPHFIDWVFRKAAREAGVLAPTYDSACLFVHVTRGEKEPCAVSTPLWNSGVNHVMVDFGDQGREGRPKVADSYAMDAASNMHSCAYRSGFDVSLPLAPERRFHTLAGIAPLDRRFFLTTKGTVYLSGHGSEERFSIAPLQDEANGVIVSMHCFENHGEHLLPENTEYCQQLKETYSDHDFASLLNTTFGLVPAGRSPGTYRLAEVMGAGAIPVIVARDVVPPFSEQHDWAAFSFTFAPDQVGPDMMATLRAIPQAQLEEMQRKSLEVYRKIFGTDDTLLGPSAFGPIADGLFNILMRRIEHRGAG